MRLNSIQKPDESFDKKCQYLGDSENKHAKVGFKICRTSDDSSRKTERCKEQKGGCDGNLIKDNMDIRTITKKINEKVNEKQQLLEE